MGENGRVIKESDDMVTVSLQRSEACAKCRACIAGMTSQEMLIEAKNECGAKVGDQVNIELESTAFLSAIGVMYGIPFLFLIAGFILGYYVSPYIGLNNIREPVGFAMGLVSVALSYSLIKTRETRFKSGNYEPVATVIIDTNKTHT